MGKVRRGGYIFEWWGGDHPPQAIEEFQSPLGLLGDEGQVAQAGLLSLFRVESPSASSPEGERP